MAKILIAAHIDVDPATREECLKKAQPYIDGALSQEGCLCYSWAADMHNPSRIEAPNIGWMPKGRFTMQRANRPRPLAELNRNL